MLLLSITYVINFDNINGEYMRTFLENIALYKKLTGNELRLVLFCYENEYRQKDLVKMSGINRCNVSKYITTLMSYGILVKKERDTGVYYRVNKKWVLPDVPGQLVIQFTE